ncbi:sugar-binding protein [Snuella sedimenti]|uniref:Endoxylanase n=1 Tax=Snuella sedimenti TaxID=2798802 RepID=A0A8J7LMW3_9FLAO|nr:sugar-binding protein [Snuella sedimenti]MBJ6367138.1 endoxylanase [Snuella sedimenti]
MGLKTYDVKHCANTVVKLTGKGLDTAWEKAVVLSDFISAWDPEPVKKIEFKALYDDDNFYFLFKVYDREVHIDKTDDTNASINESDRVELFFRSDTNLSPYYCLEIDPSPRLMDFKAYPNRNFDFNWNWPQEDITIKSDIQDRFFTVEGAISLKSLSDLKLLKNNKIETGVFRAKYNKQPDSSYEPTWISWVDPQTPTPDFHIASAFGVFNLCQD